MAALTLSTPYLHHHEEPGAERERRVAQRVHHEDDERAVGGDAERGDEGENSLCC